MILVRVGNLSRQALIRDFGIVKTCTALLFNFFGLFFFFGGGGLEMLVYLDAGKTSDSAWQWALFSLSRPVPAASRRY